MQEEPRTELLSLNDDLLLTIARELIARDVPAALRLLQTCTQARARLYVVQAEAAAAAAAEADAAFVELQSQARQGDWSSHATRQGDWAISGHQHDTMRGGNDGSKLRFGALGELLEHQFEGGTDRLHLADLVPPPR
eukprot:gene2354-2925_t